LHTIHVVIRLRHALAVGATTLTAAIVPAVSAGTVAAPCSDVTNPAGRETIDDAATGEFGPLESSPVLDVALGPPRTLYEARSVPGGILVTALETPADEFDTAVTSVSLIEYSGALRWKRCAPVRHRWALAGRAASGATTALLVEAPVGDAAATIRAIDLDSGAETELPRGLRPRNLSVWASTGGYALFGPPGRAQGRPLDPAQPFVLVDLATMVASDVPVPPAAVGAAFPSFTVTDDGVVGLDDPAGSRAPFAAFINGDWTSDAAALDATLPLWTTYSTDGPLTYFTASGAPAVTIADLSDPGDEGFREALSDGVLLVRGCARRQEWGCESADQALVGVETVTGNELWRLPGRRGVFAAGDGYALISGEFVEGEPPAAQLLIDTASGQPIDGQTWPMGTFVSGCCADPAFTRRDDGVVLTGDSAGLRVFLPLGVGPHPAPPGSTP
jgi:hypothetical protein